MAMEQNTPFLFLLIGVTESAEQITEGETYQSYKYPTMVKTQPGFKLSVMKGSYNDSQIIVLLGENGTGKTTFIRMLPADIYLIDEPSAHLDSEQRLLAAKVIKRFILHEKKTAFVVEHDFIMATYLADKHLDVTFRTDPTTYRPRINNLDLQRTPSRRLQGVTTTLIVKVILNDIWNKLACSY
ncbi:hypothetical protein C2845_PM12G09740 [Panicum miliaceum]|uniref:ABC transporter domain-containing protein n=1 Tax=Panicum miliaceum TaxID=4540 RepID=A0A3L6QIH4_PANMI|nr:hypothetical protein C2845_PM12G09740 [Panicum miliaceum]